MSEEKGKVESPAIGLSVRAQYSAGRETVFQLYFPMDVTPDGINSMLDKVNGVVDRAEAYYAQEQARRQLEVEEKAVVNMARRLAEVDGRQQEDPRKRKTGLSEKDVKDRIQAMDTLEEGKRRVAECKKFLAELIVKAGNRDGAASPTNS